MNEGIEKINSSINYFLAYYLREKYPDVICSITDVNTNPDLSICSVLVSVLDDDNNFIAKLNKDSKTIRIRMAKKVKLRKIPEIRFFIDNSDSNYQKISELLS